MTDIPARLAEQVRILRAEIGSHVDDREAYVEDILLNIYGGLGTTNVWIDDLEVRGFVEVPDGDDPRRSGGAADRPEDFAGGSSTGPARTEFTGATSGTSPGGTRFASTGSSSAGGSPVQLQGDVMSVDGRPLFPRAIRRNGESLARLRELGFNTVWLAAPAKPEELAEARRLGLWLIAPPPDWAGALSVNSNHVEVIAWDVDRWMTDNSPDGFFRQVAGLKNSDPLSGRPLIASPPSQLQNYSRHLDVLLAEVPVIGSSIELSDFAAEIEDRRRLARPGTPWWVGVQTQPHPALAAQWSALTGAPYSGGGVELEQIRLVAHQAVAAGARGLVFTSTAPLDAEDAVTRQRAAMLELINLEMLLVEPWAAAGSQAALLETSDPQVRATVLQTERSQLLMLQRRAPGAQYVAAPGPTTIGQGVSLIVSGSPAASHAYLLSSTGLVPLRHRRVTGGLQVTIDQFGQAGMILLTHDPLVINSLSRRIQVIRVRAAQLRRQIVAQSLAETETIHNQIRSRAASDQAAANHLAQATAQLRQCDQLLAAGDPDRAAAVAELADQAQLAARRVDWEAAVSALSSPSATPACVSFAALPLHWQLVDRFRGGHPGANLLPGGDMEDLGHMRQTGWLHRRFAPPDIQTSVELAPVSGVSGQHALRMQATATDPRTAPLAFDAPPLQITTGQVPVRRGQILRISADVRLASEVKGSRAGLMVYDSIVGSNLAVRVTKPGQWQPVIIYRGVPADGWMHVSLDLTGLGEAWIDNLHIAPVETAAAPNMPQNDQARRMEQAFPLPR